VMGNFIDNMSKLFSTLLLLSIIVSGCTIKLSPSKITYNTDKEIYEYKANKKVSYTLRNENQEIIDSTNVKQFLLSLEQSKNKYPYNKTIEKEHIVKHSDYMLATLYSNAIQNINDKRYSNTITNIDRIENQYKDIYKFSDCSFLKGYAFDQLKMTDSAKIQYTKFLEFSSQKYSSRIHGYRSFDGNDSLFTTERKYAIARLTDDIPVLPVAFPGTTPKLYYGSFQPGYSFNSGEYPSYTNGVIMFLFGSDFSSALNFGIQTYNSLNDFISINPRVFYSKNYLEFAFATPLQLYKSSSNNFGIKLTPFLSYNSIKKARIEGVDYYLDEKIVDFGARISVGYYFIPKLSIGAYYQYNYYNQRHPYVAENGLYMWKNSGYDVSLYYNIYREFSLKAGIKNSDVVVSFFLNGWELGYAITKSEFIVSIDMY
ncbi:MAG: hypothetical protein WD607_03690, partial [Candidatus Paceibacterota bacterium]